ncbi:MAG: tetratricopeptide repeat protein [Candidatus Coatesbacteria bacterium]|nr:MAG: tetratricopeptide repeat protein [Candidatus Coatesbacteria bacterium]
MSALTVAVVLAIAVNGQDEGERNVADILDEADAALEEGRYAEASALYENVLGVEPENEHAVEGYAAALSALDEARAYDFVLGRSTAAGGPPPAVSAKLAELMCRQGDYEGALDLLAKNETPEASFVRGRAYYKQGNIPRAIKELKDANVNGVPGADYFLGEALLSAGRHTEAAYHFRGFVEANPELSVGYAALGEACQGLGDLDKAAEHYEKALELDGRCTRARANLAYIAYLEKDYGVSIQGYNKVLADNPGDADALYNLATVYEKVDRSVARMKWQEFIELYSGDPGEAVRVANAMKKVETL